MRNEFETELMDRVIRTESRIVQLGDHVGANLRVKQRIDIHEDSGSSMVTIDSMDVSLSRILAEWKRLRPQSGQLAFQVYHNGRMVMTVYPRNG